MKYLKKMNETEESESFSVTKAPESLPEDGRPGVFLAGSISGSKDGTLAKNWQSQVQKLMAGEDVAIYNPRRDDWDSSWKQTMEDDKFREQVNWELNALENAVLIILYLDPKTKSPISLLELGLHAQSGKLLVCCPEGFYRKGNVDIVCAKYNVPMYDNMEDLTAAAIVKINI